MEQPKSPEHIISGRGRVFGCQTVHGTNGGSWFRTVVSCGVPALAEEVAAAARWRHCPRTVRQKVLPRHMYKVLLFIARVPAPSMAPSLLSAVQGIFPFLTSWICSGIRRTSSNCADHPGVLGERHVHIYMYLFYCHLVERESKGILELPSWDKHTPARGRRWGPMLPPRWRTSLTFDPEDDGRSRPRAGQARVT